MTDFHNGKKGEEHGGGSPLEQASREGGIDVLEFVSPLQQEQPEGGPGYPECLLIPAAEERKEGIDVLEFVSPLQ